VAIGLGVGQATGALVDHGTGRLGHYELITATQWRTAEGEQLAVTASGRRIALPTAALSHELRYARVGQRLHSVEAEGRVLSAWL
jgi:hypothetical protein